MFKLKIGISKLLCRLLLHLLYSTEERAVLKAAVLIVSGNPRIPSFDIGVKRGREYRRDEAAFQAWAGTGMSQSLVNMGTELSYWLQKQHKPDTPKRHHQQIGFED